MKRTTTLNRAWAARRIAYLADEIRDGEEDFLQEYHELVEKFADLTWGNAPARETDPLLYDEWCAKMGKEPTKTLRPGPQMSEINYGEMRLFMFGHWKH